MPTEIIINESLFEQPQALNLFSWENLEHQQIDYYDWNYSHTDVTGIAWNKTEDANYSNNSGNYSTTITNSNGYLYETGSEWTYGDNWSNYQYSSYTKITDEYDVTWTRSESEGSYSLTKSDDDAYLVQGSWSDIYNVTDVFSWENLEHNSINYLDWQGSYTGDDGVNWSRIYTYENNIDDNGYINKTTYSNDQGYIYKDVNGYDDVTGEYFNYNQASDSNGVVWTREQSWENDSNITTLTNDADGNYELQMFESWGWNEESGSTNTIHVVSTNGDDYYSVRSWGGQDTATLTGSIVIDGQLLHDVNIVLEEIFYLHDKVSGTALDSNNNPVTLRNKSLAEQALAEFSKFDDHQASLTARYETIDLLDTDILLDHNGAYYLEGQYDISMHYDGMALKYWSVDLDKDGNDVVAFKQFGDNFVTIVKPQIDSETQAYVNGKPAEIKFDWETGELEYFVMLESNSPNSLYLKIVDIFGSDVSVYVEVSLSGIELRITGNVNLSEGELIPGVDSAGIESIDVVFRLDGDGNPLNSYGTVTLIEGDVISFNGVINADGYYESDFNFEGDILIPDTLKPYIDSNNIDHVNLHLVLDIAQEEFISGSFEISTLEGSDLLISVLPTYDGSTEFKIDFQGDVGAGLNLLPGELLPLIKSDTITDIEITVTGDPDDIENADVVIHLASANAENDIVISRDVREDGTIKYDIDFLGELHIGDLLDQEFGEELFAGSGKIISSITIDATTEQVVEQWDEYEQPTSLSGVIHTTDADVLTFNYGNNIDGNKQFSFDFEGDILIPDTLKPYINTNNIKDVELLITLDEYDDPASGSFRITDIEGDELLISVTPQDNGDMQYVIDFSGGLNSGFNLLPGELLPYIDSDTITDIELTLLDNNTGEDFDGTFHLKTINDDSDIVITRVTENENTFKYNLDFNGRLHVNDELNAQLGTSLDNSEIITNMSIELITAHELQHVVQQSDNETPSSMHGTISTESGKNMTIELLDNIQNNTITFSNQANEVIADLTSTELDEAYNTPFDFDHYEGSYQDTPISRPLHDQLNYESYYSDGGYYSDGIQWEYQDNNTYTVTDARGVVWTQANTSTYEGDVNIYTSTYTNTEGYSYVRNSTNNNQNNDRSSTTSLTLEDGTMWMSNYSSSNDNGVTQYESSTISSDGYNFKITSNDTYNNNVREYSATKELTDENGVVWTQQVTRTDEYQDSYYDPGMDDLSKTLKVKTTTRDDDPVFFITTTKVIEREYGNEISKTTTIQTNAGDNFTLSEYDDITFVKASGDMVVDNQLFSNIEAEGFSANDMDMPISFNGGGNSANGAEVVVGVESEATDAGYASISYVDNLGFVKVTLGESPIVLSLNTAPNTVGAMPDIVVEMEDGNPVIDPTNYFGDIDGDVLTYTVTTRRPDGSDSETEPLTYITDGSGSGFYSSILTAPISYMAWGNFQYLYLINRTDETKRVQRVDTRMNGADYYGRP